ncbi:glycosyltransferase family 2 protein [Congregibacter sp.]|uniref:glycosyltransferase family 2 protein n=1 Tax=Congregibacter sp. TaxID=2744308 RepID=UPI003F6D1576
MIPEAHTAPTLHVSLVLHNSNLDQLRIMLQSLVASLRALHELLAAPASLTILDNCSDLEYRKSVTALLSDLELADLPEVALSVQQSSENAGFGVGHNQALTGTSASYLLILNPDVELSVDALREALDFFESHPEVVALNPYCEREEGSREFLCKRYPTVADLILRGLPFAGLRHVFASRLSHYEYRELDATKSAEVTLLSGACLLCRQSNFTAVKGFDPRFFMYFEDFDLSRRLAKQGQLMYMPDMKIVHHGGFAASKGLRHIRWFARSALRFFSIHGWRLL